MCAASALIAALLLAPIANAEVTNLRVEDITETEAMMRFNLKPVVDVEVQIREGDGEYQALPNTGDGWKSHNYKIHSHLKLKPGTKYEMRITPTGQEAWTVKFKTLGEALESIADEIEPPTVLELSHDIYTVPETGCQYIRIFSSADGSKYAELIKLFGGHYVPNISPDGVTTMGCKETN